jgi:Tfp pilus assembly protein PilF
VSRADCHAARALAHLANNDIVQALQDLTTAIGDKPHEPRFWAERAFVHLKQRDFLKAVDDYTQALLRAGADVTPVELASWHNGRGTAYSHLSQSDATLLEKAREDAERAIAFDPENSRYYKNRAAVLERLGRPAEPDRAMARGLDSRP